MSVRPLRHDKRCGWFSKSRGLSASVSFFSSPPPPRLLAPFFARPLLRKSTEMLASQAIKPEAQLQNRNIMWTSITSAGEHLPLLLDSCCSVSLVSKLHAAFVASKRPDLKYCTLEERISVTAADPKSNLQAVATMEIPITWETNTETVFTMLVVPGLVWPILFGENHLHTTQALVDLYVPAVTFRDPSMQFRVHCSLDNPLKGFTSDSAPNASLSHQSGQTASKPHVSVTCLLTGAPPPGVHKFSQSLHRGLNLLQSVSPFLQL